MSSVELPLAFMNIGMPEIIIIGIVGILLFGRRLPEVGKNLGKTIVEFKKGLSATTDEINKVGTTEQEELSEPAPKRMPGKTVVKRIAASDEP